ncbi:hypothetical protein [Burkholderia multivorans]|uniref:hypothetical protein n=1 Tax=Burkholderia multivorans TaxID=87883 RepID=UPI0004F8BC20|nr:hypothetical protein [Burkholderia multivorans]AIO75405.1 putative gp10 [Burkholderia multivorans]MCA8437465.1 hypothetical protein [Burkholderia multivorans]MCO1361769.1 hypothetical protein [Burkholderia multivorans]MCO1421540.1 hypothetical protein [Burkholderia multivorans]UQO94068.1 hypothetical protein L0Z41_12825 [Burkholderia multivorans]
MTTPQGPRRAPAGVMSSKPVSLRLLPAERSQLEQLARREPRSLASLTRLIYLEGLPHYLAKVSSFENTSAKVSAS